MIPPAKWQVRPVGRRSSYRPRLEAMESRALMATGSPLVVATLGDSLTDEYSFYGPLPASSSFLPLPANIYTIGRNSARNWDLDLAATRAGQLTFGAYTTADQGETRNQGFAENWARSGNTAAGFNISNSGTTFQQEYAGYTNEFPPASPQQQPGLLTQTVANSGYDPAAVNVVAILIGANDYLRAFTNYAESGGTQDVFTPATPNGLNPLNAAIENSINEAVTQIQATIPNAKVVLVTTPDITITPAIQLVLNFVKPAFPTLGNLVSTSDANLTNDLTAYAGSKGIGLVNFETLYQQFKANPVVDGVTVNLAGAGQNLTDGFIGDGFHPGTLVQGLLAQAIVGQINAQYGSNVVAPLTDAEILGYGLATTPTIAVSANAAPGVANTVTLQAVVQAGAGSTHAATGTVTFEYYTAATSSAPAQFGASLGTVPLAAGVASLNVNLTSFPAGTVVAVYNGNQFNTVQESAPIQVSAPLIPINPIPLPITPTQLTSVITVTPTYARVKGLATVTLSIIVSPGADAAEGSVPAGTVAIGVGPRRQRYVALVDGRAQVSYPLGRLRGQFVSAAYSGDGTFAASGSQFIRINPHPFVVHPGATAAKATRAVRVVAGAAVHPGTPTRRAHR